MTATTAAATMVARIASQRRRCRRRASLIITSSSSDGAGAVLDSGCSMPVPSVIQLPPDQRVDDDDLTEASAVRLQGAHRG